MKPDHFQLHERLAKDSLYVTDLPLCTVRLMDDKRFPWVLLIPQVAGAREWIDLAREQQHQLSDEIAIVSHIFNALVTPDKLNVAALGNRVPQLHIHLIARYKTDAAWPNPVWGEGISVSYTPEESRRFIYELKSALDSLQLA
jgi:diadenosine tetraphosphate (Ap4A) HIT family hydrolase